MITNLFDHFKSLSERFFLLFSADGQKHLYCEGQQPVRKHILNCELPLYPLLIVPLRPSTWPLWNTTDPGRWKGETGQRFHGSAARDRSRHVHDPRHHRFLQEHHWLQVTRVTTLRGITLPMRVCKWVRRHTSRRSLLIEDQIALLKGATFEVMEIRFNMVFNSKTGLWECGHATYCIEDAVRGEITRNNSLWVSVPFLFHIFLVYEQMKWNSCDRR